jgi:GNAT superfamily N-acetyltransferase
MEVGADYTIRELSSSDRLNSFKTGDAAFVALKSFLTNQSIEFHSASIAKTYVAIALEKDAMGELVEASSVGVLAYITLICSEIDMRTGYIVEDCTHANTYDSLPAIKIARLAVDKRYRGQRIGDQLVALAIAIASDIVAPVIGCRFVITDAKSAAINFYSKVGFTMLETEINRALENPVMFIDLRLANEPIVHKSPYPSSVQ